MNQRFWVVGGEYADCAFSAITPGTETICGPFANQARVGLIANCRFAPV